MIFHQEKEECRVPRNADYGNNITTNNINISTTNRLILPYKRKQGQKTIKSVNYWFKRLLPENHVSQHILGSSFDIKEQTKLEHKHDLIYLVECSEISSGETTRRMNKEIMENAGKSNKLPMLKHMIQSGHLPVSPNDVRVLRKRHRSNKVKRKISEALLIIKYQPSLNIHTNSVTLELFNSYAWITSCYLHLKIYFS